MKKKFSVVLMIMSLAFSAFALTACGHTHDYKETVLENGTNIATEATCTAKATYYKVCQCGEVHATETFEYGSMLPHDYQAIVATGETNLVTPATCSTYAVYKKVCSECGVEHATETFQGTEYDANAHVFEETIGTENKVSDATCISLAVYKKLCACGEMHATETFTAGTVDSTNHVGFDNEVIDDKYLVAEGGANHFHGTRYYKSCDCGEAHASDYFEADDVIPHTFNVDTVNPDALKEGADHTHGNIYYKSCECGAIGTEATFEDTSSVIPHTFDQEVISTEALKEGANHFHGNIYYKSCECGAIGTEATFEDTASKIAHTFDQLVKSTDTLKEEANHAHGTIYYKSCSCGTISDTETFEDTDKTVYALGTLKGYLDDSNANVVFDLSELATTYEVTLANLVLTYGGKTINTFTLEDGILTVAESEFIADNGKQLSGVIEVSIIVNGVDGESQVLATFNATASLTIVTRLITTPDEFLGMKNDMLADYATVGTTSGVDLKRYGGYFELGNNIDMQGATYNTFHNWYEGIADGWTKTGGFQGVFDGQGYTVSNFTISGAQGIFGGVLGQNGVVKNVAFVNVNLASNNSNVIAQNLYGGTVQDLYIQANQLKLGGQQNGSSLVAFCIDNGATVKNIFAEVDSLNYTPGSLGYRDTNGFANDNWVNVIGRALDGIANYENIIAITAGEAVLNDGTAENSTTVIGAGDVNLDAGRAIAGFPTREILKQNLALVSPVFNLLDKNYWAVADDGMLVWKSLAIPATATLSANRLAINGSTDVALVNAGLANAGVVWSSASEGVTISGSTISIANTVVDGTVVTITATNRYGATKSFELNTYAAIVTNHDEVNISLCDNAASITIPVTAKGIVNSVSFDGAEITDFTFEGGNITIPKSVYQNTLKKTTLVVKTVDGEDEYQDNIPLDIATMVIEDKADLLAFATLTRGNTWGVGELYVLDGDIDMEGATYNFNLNVTGQNGDTEGKTGFAGIFDGRGYVIENIVVGANGFISGIRKDGCVKNISFINATQNGTGFFAMADGWSKESGGSVENVYLQVKATVSNSAAFACGSFGTTRNINVVVEVLEKVDTYAFWGICYHGGFGSHNNVYGIGVDKIKQGASGEPITASDKTQVFANFGAFKAGGTDVGGNTIDYTQMDNDFWDIVNGVPVPANLKSAPVIKNTEEVAYSGSNIVIELSNAIAYAKYELVEAVAGVTIANNVVTVTDEAQGKTFTVKVTNLATEQSATKSFVVPQTIVKTADEFNVSLDEITSDTVVIPYTEEGTIEKVTFDGTEISGYTHENGVSITIAKSVLANNLKLANLVITAQQGIDVVQTTIPLDVATLIIDSEADLLAFPTIANKYKNGESWGAGLYVLDADITCVGNYVNNNEDASNGWAAPSKGFGGTFDGRGHVIKNINVGGNGFIAGLAANYESGGKLINVSFVNATYTSTYFLGRNNGGLLENVYIQATALNSGNTGIFYDNFGTARMRKLVVEYVGGNGTYYLQGNNINQGGAQDGYIYAIGVNTAVGNGLAPSVKGTANSNPIGMYATVADMKSANNNYTAMDNAFWDIVNGMPVPAKLKSAQDALAILNDATAPLPIESKLTINVEARPYLKYELTEVVEGVSIDYNVVSISATAQGKTFTVKVTDQASGEVASKTFTVKVVEVVELTTSKDINLGTKTTTTTIDCADFLNAKSIADEEVTRVSLNGVELEYTVENGVITVTKAPLNVEANLGEQILSVEATNDSGDYVFNQSVVVCSLIISSKEDADRMFECALDTNDSPTIKSKTGYFILGASFSMQNTAIGIGFWGNDTAQGIPQKDGGQNINPCYRATFDGRGYTISDVKYTNNAQALFGATAHNCMIKNLNMINVDVASTTGALYSTVNGTSSISNVFIQGKFTKYQNASWGPVAFGSSKVDAWTGSFTNLYAVLNSHVSTVAAQGDAVVTDYTGVFIGTTSAATGHLVNCAALNLQAETAGKEIKLAPADTISTAVNTTLVHTKEEGYALTGHSGSAWEAFKAYCAPAQAE